MRYVSTRGGIASLGIREALDAGIAPDGGLLIPEAFPVFSMSDFAGLKTPAEIGARLLKPFFETDSILSKALPRICEQTFEFPIPLTPLQNGDCLLELFHGPTSAFKDVGARFLAGCMESLAFGGSDHQKPRTILVATSGDTGGAVAAAFYRRVGVEVVILFPKGRISPRQETQLCAWGENVQAFAVKGTFDDCQRMAKEALLKSKSDGMPWLSANSINLGRILPQMIYYAYSALTLKNHPGFIIPSGNLGNAMAALWAKRMGLPIEKVAFALNANQSVIDFYQTGVFHPGATISTLANAMDVGNPSNLERLKVLYPSMESLRKDVIVNWVSDEEIRSCIRTSEKEWGQVLCPHTAVAAVMRKRMVTSTQPWVLVATAHPAKFESIVEPLVGHKIPIPPSLASILKQKVYFKTIEPTVQSLLKAKE